MATLRSVIIHGHFYQPPREDPWTGRVAPQPSAAPDSDWNARITRECYGPITAARFSGPEGDVTLNLLEYLSFNFGPTLLAWMEREAPEVYARVLQADAASADRLGHGNAIAQSFHHTILPLATARDKRTEVRWGITDFRERFGRSPVGLWLPETAVDDETLDVVGDEGIQFVLLAPHQVDPAPVDGGPVRYRTRGAVDLALMPYDGALSHDVAFGNAARDGAAWAERLASVPALGSDHQASRGVVAIATDGETYGHHHAFAEMGLAAALVHLGRRDDVTVENVASLLARMPDLSEAGIGVSLGMELCARRGAVAVELWVCPRSGIRTGPDVARTAS